MAWPRPTPSIGDPSSSRQRAADVGAWALAPGVREAVAEVIGARRDIRRFRPDPIPDDVLGRLLAAAHAAPSVGHSQPWRFVIVTESAARQRAANLADSSRLAQAAEMDEESGRHLLDLDLEGIREAPIGIVVCCDRRAPAAGVLGRATFVDADVWSCACAIQNLWLAARAEGLGVGWVTLFDPRDLAGLVQAPEGVVTLGWLCVGWPDERPPFPGLERRGWSQRSPLESVVVHERWPSDDRPPPPSRVRPPAPAEVVAAHDSGDRILTAPGSLGVLDRAIDRILAVVGRDAQLVEGRLPATLILAAADHPVVARGVSAYPPAVTRHVLEATVGGCSVGAVAATAAEMQVVAVDAGVDGPPVGGAMWARPAGPRGDLVETDALTAEDVATLVAAGEALAGRLSSGGLVALGEAGVGNTTASAAVACALLDEEPARLVGLGAGGDRSMVLTKQAVVEAALARYRAGASGPHDWPAVLAALGGGELAFLTGCVIGAAAHGSVVVVDGMATSVAALLAVRAEPGAAAHLVAGQRSREPGHPVVLRALGLEPLLDLRLRSGEGVGACLAVGALQTGLLVRRTAAPVD